MKKSPIALLFVTILVSSNALAQLVLPPGQYRSQDGCHMTISRADHGEINVRIDKGAAYLSARFRNMILSRSEQILEIGTCKSGKAYMLDRRVNPGQPVEFKVANDDQIARTYLTRCGGSFNVTDFRVYWAVSNSDSSLVALRADNYIAKYSLPNGLHSGPIKTNEYPLTCQKFSRIR